MILCQLRELPIPKRGRSGSLRKGMRCKQSLPTVWLAKDHLMTRFLVTEIFSDAAYLKDPQGWYGFQNAGYSHRRWHKIPSTLVFFLKLYQGFWNWWKSYRKSIPDFSHVQEYNLWSVLTEILSIVHSSARRAVRTHFVSRQVALTKESSDSLLKHVYPEPDAAISSLGGNQCSCWHHLNPVPNYLTDNHLNTSMNLKQHPMFVYEVSFDGG